MIIDTIVYDALPQFFDKSVVIFGTDQRCVDLVTYIRKNKMPITIKFFLDFKNTAAHCQLPTYAVEDYLRWHDLSGECVIIANDAPVHALNCLLDSKVAEVYLCSRQLHTMFAPAGQTLCQQHSQKHVQPFMMESGTPRVPVLVSNAYVENEKTVYEIADFQRQEFTTYTVPQPNIPLSLRDFSSQTRIEDLPMRMSHLGYLLWKRSTHVVQMSYGRRYIVAPRYNFFHLDILDTHTGIHTQWHDKDASEGLWDYVATGDFDDNEEAFYFVRWPLEDALRGMADGSNTVRCQVCKLYLETLQAEVLHEFVFQDRIHQVTISGDGRYMVFAPMRVLRPKQNPKTLPQEELMRRLQEWVVLDPMATLDLHTGKVWQTEIPFPIPAHFELDPFDPHLFYVSTHSLMPHADGVVAFQPGTLHKARIHEGKTVIEATYTHSRFIRTAQHCPFPYKDKVLIAATNQNRLEIIDAADMTQWHCHKLDDDPLYDNANFDDPEFLKKPFSLPVRPAHCDSISAATDGRHLVLRIRDGFGIFDLDTRTMAGKVLFRTSARPSSHSRFYMQNAPNALLHSKYAELMQSK